MTAGPIDRVISRFHGASGTQTTNERDDMDLKKACADFEAIFIYRMLETMRKTVPKGGLFSRNDPSEGPYRALMDQKLAESLASRGEGIGIRRLLYEQLKK